MVRNALNSKNRLRPSFCLLPWSHGLQAGRLRGVSAGLGFVLLVGFLALGNWSCDSDDDDCICCGPDLTAPAAPRGFYSITGDWKVTLVWLANTEPDLEGYDVWWTDNAHDPYLHYLGTVAAEPGQEWVEFVHGEVENGMTYYYAVTAFDRAGNESEKSWETDDTPRPEGGPVSMNNSLESINYAGFDLSRGERVSRADPNADFHYKYWLDTGEAFLFTGWYDSSGENVLIQDMGYTESFEEIGFGPPSDEWIWSPSGIVEAIPGHTYVLLTLVGESGYYAKIRLTSVETAVSPSYVTFDWAYQKAPWNRELKVPE